MKALRLAAVLFLLLASSCSSSDREFRTRVSSVSVTAAATSDPESGATSGTVEATVEFRDPRDNGLAK